MGSACGTRRLILGFGGTHRLAGGQPRVAMTWGRSTVVRMPGGAAHTTGHGVDRPVGGVAGRDVAHPLDRHREAQVDVERGVALDRHPPARRRQVPGRARARSCSTSGPGSAAAGGRPACPPPSAAGRRRCRPRACRRRSRRSGWPAATSPLASTSSSGRPSASASSRSDGPKLVRPCDRRPLVEGGGRLAEAHDLEQQVGRGAPRQVGELVDGQPVEPPLDAT